MTFVYSLGKLLCRIVHVCCVRRVVIHGERLGRAGGYVLACTHLGHLEPAFISLLSPRPIDWMTRIEFYRYRLFANCLNAIGAIPVNRAGIPVRAIRDAIDRVRRRRVVGIFPEGGVARGADSVMMGGPVKRGACVVALRSNAPVVPVVVLGTDVLSEVRPWLPFKRINLQIIVGEPVYPPANQTSRRVAREIMSAELEAGYRALYRELCEACGLDATRAAGMRTRA